MHFEIFDSFEAMLEAIQASRTAADRRIQPWQKLIVPGDYTVRFLEQDSVAIYSEILDPIDVERPYYNLDDPDEAKEFASVVETFGTKWQKSYRFGRHYSIFCPDGELGDIHLSAIAMKIDPEAFERAKLAGWPPAL